MKRLATAILVLASLTSCAYHSPAAKIASTITLNVSIVPPTSMAPSL